MEEDIKILEEMVIKSRELREEEFYKLIGIKQIQAIANTINRLKEYKEHALFVCDPEKYKECKKTDCYINKGNCELTRHIEYRKDIDEEAV